MAAGLLAAGAVVGLVAVAVGLVVVAAGLVVVVVAATVVAAGLEVAGLVVAGAAATVAAGPLVAGAAATATVAAEGPPVAAAECALVAVAELHYKAAAGVVPGWGRAAAVRALASPQAVVRGPPVATGAPILLIAVAVDAILAAADTVDTTPHGTASAGRSPASA